ncbi:DinB family protein [Mycolicibacterium sp. ND9-15]|uniref:DinB family protein n=1 Tax=Mycolicibacterium sp. ND9-15 TaxID=3042320 RepID=UPI002DDB75A8|nr:DinB family protein [Mycolicibacterium sp. ND9-15]WSE58973.1 DinB family protein [Mycolicibacterium sp. ND9-15]
MPAMPAPATGELASLLEYLRYQHQAFDVTSYGLTDEQARCTPTASSLCIGGLIKHMTTMEYAWTQQVLTPPGLAQDPWSLEGMMVTWERREEQFVMRDKDTLAGLLERLTAQNAATMGVLGDADLDASVRVPNHIYAAYGVAADCTVRWVVLHLIEEFTRHAGHADIIRECIDGATMYELLAAVEGWPETGRFKPWKPAAHSVASDQP